MGNYGRGTLNISHGGAVTVTGTTFVSSSKGTISFGAGGGALTTGSLAASASQLTGTGTIVAHGLTSDVSLVFNSAASLRKTLTLSNVTVDLDMRTPASNGTLGGLSHHGIPGNPKWDRGAVGRRLSRLQSGSTGNATVNGANSIWTSTNELRIGYNGTGTLAITNGGAVNVTGDSYIGRNSTATGRITVSGANSKWSNSNYLYVGYVNKGTLEITNGGTAYSRIGTVGYDSYSVGTVTVDHANSKWDSEFAYVGFYGNGTLNITNGGTVSSLYETIVSWNKSSKGAINFGNNGGTLTTKCLYALPLS